MKILDYFFKNEEYHNPEGIVITVICPICNEYTDVEKPDGPLTGKTRAEGWCTWCGKKFIFFY